MRIVLVLLLVLSVLLVGCKAKAPEPQPVATTEPVEKTPEMIAQELRTPLAPLLTTAPGATIPEQVRQKMISDVRGVCTANKTTDNGKQAISQVRAEVESVVGKARDAKLWSVALAAAEVYEVFEPGSTKFDRLKNTCNAYLKMPKVKMKGFFNVDTQKDEIYAFLQVSPPGGVKKDVKVRVGEEFEGFRFVRIVGELQGVELEYLELPGEFIRVMR